MAIDTTTPRSRRALIAGALGGALASVGLLAKAPEVRAGSDGDVVLDDANTGTATTAINAAGSSPAFLVTGGGSAIRGEASDGPGVIGVGPSGLVPETIDYKAGVYGTASGDPGVFGRGYTSAGVRGESDTEDGMYGQASLGDEHPDHDPGAGIHGHGGLAGVLGTGDSSFGVLARSNTVPAVFATNNSATAAAIVAEGGPGTAIHGHTPGSPYPNSPALTGVYGSATGAGVAIAADAANGLALRATSSAGAGIKARGALDGVIGESPGGKSGVVGYSGSGSAPAGPSKTGVYGEASQDTTSRGVSGFSLSGQGVRGEATTGQGVQGIATTGQAVRGDTTGGTGVHGQATTGKAVRGVATTGDGVTGETTSGKAVRGVATAGDGVAGQATTGVGVRATATTGVALAVAGRATFSRSGKVTIPVGVKYIDVTVPGGLASTAMAFATLQYLRSGVYVMGARPNWPSSGKLRIYISKALSTATPVAWFVVG
jgi:hypothetical protein